MMLNRCVSRKAILLGWLVFVWAPLSSARMRVTIDGAEFKPYPVAVPDVQADPASQAIGALVTTLLRTDIDLTRHFVLVPPATYVAPAGESYTQPNLRNWQNVGASGLIRGRIAPMGAQSLLQLRFYDTHQARVGLARECRIDGSDVGACVHGFLNELVTLLTGEPGIFTTRIAFVRREGRKKTIWSCDVDGGAAKRLVDDNSLTLLPAWDPSGRFLLYTSYPTGRAYLYRRGVAALQAETLSARKGLNMGAAVSPDGKRIAMTLSYEGNSDIYVTDWDGQHLTRLTRGWGQDVSPAWSPDGSAIAFVSNRSGAPHLYTMKSDGSDQKRLTFQGSYNQEPDWSPRQDGRIVFTARDEHLHYDLFSIAPEGGRVRRLTQDAGDNDGPSFAPDGRHIVFTSTRGPGRKRALYIMDEEGKKVRPIAASVADVETPAWGPRAP